MTDAAALQRLWEQGRQQLEVARRQGVVYDLYARRHKHAMVCGSLGGVAAGRAGRLVLGGLLLALLPCWERRWRVRPRRQRAYPEGSCCTASGVVGSNLTRPLLPLLQELLPKA